MLDAASPSIARAARRRSSCPARSNTSRPRRVRVTRTPRSSSGSGVVSTSPLVSSRWMKVVAAWGGGGLRAAGGGGRGGAGVGGGGWGEGAGGGGGGGGAGGGVAAARGRPARGGGRGGPGGGRGLEGGGTSLRSGRWPRGR